MTEPFLIIYLHQVQAISLSLAGAVIGSSGLAGVIAIPISGWLTTHIRTKHVFLISLVFSAVGRLFFLFAGDVKTAFIASILSGGAGAVLWNTLSIIIADSADRAQTRSIFGTAFALQNLGSGVGAALGSTIIHSNSAFSFKAIFILDACSFLLFSLFGQKWVKNGPKEKFHRQMKQRRKQSCSSAPQQSSMIVLCFCYTIFAVVMTGLSTTLFPQWVAENAQTPLRVVGHAFFLNSLMIVMSQLLVLRRTTGMRSTRVISLAACVFAAENFMILSASLLQSGLASLAFILAFAISAIGENCLFSGLPALINRLATEETRGSYNSAMNTAWQIGSILGPIISGAFLSQGMAVPLFILFIGALVILVFLLHILERIIPCEWNKGA
ncbi:MFS transporter [Sporolactobacillus shoreicorticis]|nr:MFS transporter [Sporolactobacillus shoreicorticis]